MYTNFQKTLAIWKARVYNVLMTDKNRISRENAVAEALLGPGKTARNLMRLLFSAHESGQGIRLELWNMGSDKLDEYQVDPRAIPDDFFLKSANTKRLEAQSVSPANQLPDGTLSASVRRRLRAQGAIPVASQDGAERYACGHIRHVGGASDTGGDKCIDCQIDAQVFGAPAPFDGDAITAAVGDAG